MHSLIPNNTCTHPRRAHEQGAQKNHDITGLAFISTECALPVSSEYLLELGDVVILIGLHKVGHGQNLRVVLVWLGLGV